MAGRQIAGPPRAGGCTDGGSPCLPPPRQAPQAALKTLVGQVTVFPAYLGSFFIYSEFICSEGPLSCAAPRQHGSRISFR